MFFPPSAGDSFCSVIVITRYTFAINEPIVFFFLIGAAAPMCAAVLEASDIERDDTWMNALILFSLFFFVRILAACLLAYKTKNFY